MGGTRLSDEARHEEALCGLVARLSRKKWSGQTLFILHQPYETKVGKKHYCGEMDLCMIRMYRDKVEMRYYEVKGKHSSQGAKRAYAQLKRHYKAFPHMTTKHLYYAPGTIVKHNFISE